MTYEDSPVPLSGNEAVAGAGSAVNAASDDDAMAAEVIISIDPGRAKCGIAVMAGPCSPQCLKRSVVETNRLVLEIGTLLRSYAGIRTLIIGSGTGSAPLRRAVKSTFTTLEVISVDEYRSSERARARYLKENVPYGWRRLMPAALRTPELPYDDYVAIILAEEYFQKKLGTISSKA